MTRRAAWEGFEGLRVKKRVDSAEERGEPQAGIGAAWVVLAALLGVVAVRVTMTEVLHPTLAQRMWALVAPADGQLATPAAGTTLGIATITLVLAGAAAWVKGLRRMDWVGLGILGAIGVWLGVSTWAATNRFAAIVGAADLLAAVAAGWAAGVLCRGGRERRLVVCVLMAILTAWIARGLVQYFVDYPDLFEYYRKNKSEALQQNGITPGSAQETAFWYRLHARELSGFVTMSNVYANGLVGLCTAALGVVLGGAFWRKRVTTTNAEGPGREAGKTGRMDRSPEIPLYPILLGGTILVLIGGIVCLWLTGSKGGVVATLLCLAVLGAGVGMREWVGRHREAVALVVVGGFMCGAGALVGYGVARDSLPSKSMMFRWHYWTATAPMVQEHPWTGVGLNNYGDFYSALKRPSSPEDVKDPHSFFVRLVAEGGWPLALLVAGMLGMYFYRAARGGEAGVQEGAEGRGVVLATGAIILVGWWIAHTLIAEPLNPYSASMSAVYGGISLAALVMVTLLSDEIRAEGWRIVMAAVLVGAAGMLLYDQVNMALVTGPVAMLFWVMLGSAAPEAQSNKVQSGGGKVAGRVGGGVLVVAGMLLGVGVWGPTVEGTFEWDPGPWEERFAEHATRGASAKAAATQPQIVAQMGAEKLRDVERAENESALAAVNRAAMLAPRDGGLIRQRIRLRAELGYPVAEDIRRLLALDKGNAGVRVDLAKGESDLPAEERARILEEALWLDAQLPEGEAKKLTKEQRGEIAAIIARLKGK